MKNLLGKDKLYITTLFLTLDNGNLVLPKGGGKPTLSGPAKEQAQVSMLTFWSLSHRVSDVQK